MFKNYYPFPFYYSEKSQTTGKKQTFGTDGLLAGMYFLQLKIEGVLVSKKLLVR